MDRSLPLEPVVSYQPTRAAAGWHWQRWLLRATLWVVLIDIGVAAVYYGLKLRRWTWDNTAALHFRGDVQNRYAQGYRADRLGGTVALFDRLKAIAKDDPDAIDRWQLDYTPQRLWLMTWWYRWTTHQPEFRVAPGNDPVRGYISPPSEIPYWVYNNVNRWQNSYRFNEPLLKVNIACELASALAVFLLVMLWTARRDPRLQSWPVWLARLLWYRVIRWRPRPVRPLRPPWLHPIDKGAILGLFAALICWFNPAVILDSHAWPQWDVWILPCFLWACLFASVEAWILAGAVLAAGAMFKGQLLFVVPFFVLWPLFAGRFFAFFHVLIGLALGGAAMVWPWLWTDPMANGWLWRIGLAWVFIAPWPLLRRRGRGRGQGVWLVAASVASVAAVVLVAAPWLAARDRQVTTYALVAAPVLFAILLVLPARQMPFLLLGALAAGLWMSLSLYGGSMIWYEVGFRFGADRFPDLVRPETNNLAYLLSQMKPKPWNDPDMIVWHINPGDLLLWPKHLVQVSAHRALALIYAGTLVLCAIAAAVHYRRKDPRVLLAMVAPWALMFAFAPQMHQRYLVWAAGTSALVAASGLMPLLWSLLITALSAGMILHTMLTEGMRYAGGYNVPSAMWYSSPQYRVFFRRLADQVTPQCLRDFFAWLYQHKVFDTPRLHEWLAGHRTECAHWVIGCALFLMLYSLIPRPKRPRSGRLADGSFPVSQAMACSLAPASRTADADQSIIAPPGT